jgi:hypothetical protein
MFWAGIATLVMAMTGKGDDTAPFRHWIESIREGIVLYVHDMERQGKALLVVGETEEEFRRIRVDGSKVSACLEHLDRKYDATAAEYEKCLAPSPALWDRTGEGLVVARAKLMQHVTQDEAAAVRKHMGNP